MRKTATLIVLLFSILSVFAEDVSFTASAPKQVVQGRPFQLTYTVNQRSKDLRAPDMPNFEVLAGPYSSTSTNISMVNGDMTTSYTQTYTYTLLANETGTFTIPAATIMVGKTQYQSNGLKIEVLPPDQPADNGSTGQAERQQMQDAGGSISKDNIFIRTLVTKTTVSEQECLLLQYKLYFAGVDVSQFTNNTKIPEFTGFLKQEIDLGQIQTELEHYNGRNYNTAVLYQTLLYPQHSGDLQIDPASFEAIIRVQNRAQVRSIFDDFFGSYTNYTKQLTAPGITIHAKPLPAGKPEGFLGGVGQFSMDSKISTNSLKANEAVTLTLTIKGTGNLKLVKTPSVDFPEGFEVYDPKVNNNFKTTTSGITGSKTIEYLAIARAPGEFTIPSVKFSYYDTKTGQYQTLATQPYTLNVERGAEDQTTVSTNIAVNKENIKQLGTDIRYIYTGSMPEHKKPLLVFGTLPYLLCFLVPLLIATILFIAFRHQLKERADIRRMKYKRAGKVVQKRLKNARQLLQKGDKTAFYEEIERALIGYLSDRLGIATADLNRQNIIQILTEKNISQDILQQLGKTLDDAQFARYAPSADSHQMQTLYDQTADIIEQLETKKL